MPNRVLKESIKRSPQIDSLTWFEEVVFYRMIVTADDFGCLDGRAVLLKNELFPTKDNITKKSIEDAVSRLVSVGLVCRYTSSGMPYLFLPTWERHQRIRNQHRKFPEPPAGIRLSADCCQMSADCQPESESESESKTESEVYTHPTLPREGAPGPKTPDLNRDGETGGRSHAAVRPQKPKPPDPFAAYAGEDAELLKALRDFEEMRLKIKKPMTDRAKRQLCDRLDALAGDSAGKIRLLDEAVLHCWQSVYVHDGGGKGKSTASPVSSAPGEDSIRREELRQWEELLTYGAIQEGGGGV